MGGARAPTGIPATGWAIPASFAPMGSLAPSRAGSKRSLSGNGALLPLRLLPRPTNNDSNILNAIMTPRTIITFSLVDRFLLRLFFAILNFNSFAFSFHLIA
jgi:hypothetical protein